MPADGYGDWGGPLGGGFMATGTNQTYSTAANWTHTFSNTFLMEVRGGTSYYHNEALTTANGQNLAEQVGIKGVNLDEWTSGPTTINIAQRLLATPSLGYVGSLPWDRWERTWEFSTTLTKVLNNHTIKFGGNFRKNSDKLLQTQDNQGPARRVHRSAAPRRARRPTPRRTAASPTRSPPSCSTSPAAWRAT